MLNLTRNCWHGCGAWFSSLSLSSALLSQPSLPDAVSKSLETFCQSKISQSDCLNPSPVLGWTVETRTKQEAQSLPWIRKSFQTYFFSNIGGLVIMFHSNLKLSKRCASQLNSYPKFYQDLIHLRADVRAQVSGIC